MSPTAPRTTPSATTLLLVPTAGELAELGAFPETEVRVERCGFGPVAAAARTAELLARHRPERAVLVGIAGSFTLASLPVGSAWIPSAVCLEGVGVGRSGKLLSPSELRLPQWRGDPGESDTPGDVHETLPLAGSGNGLLLTVCAASADAREAAERLARHPEARAEDMEGFGAALACHLARVPLTVVRGISNAVGERDPRRWEVRAALAAARGLVREILAAVAHSGQGRAAR